MRNKGLRIAKYTYLETDRHIAPIKPRYSNKSFFWRRLYIYCIGILLSLSISCYHLGFLDDYLEYSRQFIADLTSVHSIVITNNKVVSKQEIENIIDLTLPIEIYELDLGEIKKNIERHSYIKKAELTIITPSVLYVDIIERSPSAVWLNKGKCSLIDLDGAILQNDFALHDKMSYVSLLGEKANEKWRFLFDELKNHPIYEKIHAAQLISNRRWNLLLKDGLIIKLPEENTKIALDSMKLLLDNYKIPDKFTIIDLRLTPKKIYGIF